MFRFVGQPPKQDRTREAFDKRVDPEPDKRDAPCEVAGANRDCRLKYVPTDREILKQPSAPDERDFVRNSVCSK